MSALFWFCFAMIGLLCLLRVPKGCGDWCLALLGLTLMPMYALMLPATAQSALRGNSGICDPQAPNNCISTPVVARIQSAATTNATSVKTTAALVQSCALGNNGAAAAYFKIYNLATAPTVGTSTPLATILIPIGGAVNTWASNLGLPLSTGFAYAITGGAADSDTTAVAANQVMGFCAYN